MSVPRRLLAGPARVCVTMWQCNLRIAGPVGGYGWPTACWSSPSPTVLVRPLYKAEYLDAWNSIESTFISDARFLSDHWAHPGWQPNWYTGTRTDYVYPPALRYGTALR